MRLSASETPEFETEIEKLLGEPPAVTVGTAKLFVTESFTSSTIATVVELVAVSSSELAFAVFGTLGSESVVVATW